MSVPRCPLCGVVSSWRRTRGELNGQIADECHYCKREEETHWRQWWQGPDMTEAGCRMSLGSWPTEYGADSGPEYDGSNR